MSAIAQELKGRTKQFDLRIVRFVQALGDDKVSIVLGKQLNRSIHQYIEK